MWSSASRRLGAGALPVPGPAHRRCHGRSALCAADRGRRHCAHRHLRAQWLDRQHCWRRSVSRSPSRRSASSSHWSSSACPSSCAPCSRCSRRSTARSRRRPRRSAPSGCGPSCASCFPPLLPALTHRLRAGLRARRRRVRLGHLHRRQHPLRLRDRAAADRHQARGVRLCRRHGHRHDHAGHFLRHAAGRSTRCRPGAAGARRCLTSSLAARTPRAADRRSPNSAAAAADRRSRCCSRHVPGPAAGDGLHRGFAKGVGVYLEALAEPDALSAIRLTLLVAAIAVPLNLVFGLAAAWAIAKFEFRGKHS